MKILLKKRFRKRITVGNVKFFLMVLFAIFAFDQTNTVSAQKPSKAKRQEQIFAAETLLDRLGYWITKVDGAADASTYQAVVAFQKVEGRRRTGVVNQTELAALRRASRPAARFAGEAHIEIDITLQVLFLVDENAIATRVLPISSGNEEKYFDEQAGKWAIAYTPRGEFKITRQISGIRRAPLGNLYYPNYFTGGVAIHGSLLVPFQPASHGCVRIPNFAAEAFQKLVRIGTPVLVYD